MVDYAFGDEMKGRSHKNMKLCCEIWLCCPHTRTHFVLFDWPVRPQGHSPYRPVILSGHEDRNVSWLAGLSAYRDTLCEILPFLSPQREYFSPDWLWGLNSWKCNSERFMLMTRCVSKHQFISRWLAGLRWRDCARLWFGTCQHKPALWSLVLREKQLQMEYSLLL